MQAKKKLTALLLSLCMVLGMLPMTAFAAGVPAAPTNLKLELTETGLKASWDKPETTGGLDIFEYEVTLYGHFDGTAGEKTKVETKTVQRETTCTFTNTGNAEGVINPTYEVEVKAREGVSGTGDPDNLSGYYVTDWTGWSSSSSASYKTYYDVSVKTSVNKHYTGVVDVGLPGSENKLHHEGITATGNPDVIKPDGTTSENEKQAVTELLYQYFEKNKATVPELANVTRDNLMVKTELESIYSSRTIESINTEGRPVVVVHEVVDKYYDLRLVYKEQHEHVWAEDWTSDGTHHWKACTAEGCAEKDQYGVHQIANGVCTVCKAEVETSGVQTYAVKVNGITVTSANASDILGDADGDGATAYYDPAANTLTLDNAQLTSSGFGAVWAQEENFTLVLKGENQITGEGDFPHSAVYSHGAMTVKGNGSLTTSGTYFGLFGNNTITIEDGASVDLTVDFSSDEQDQPYAAVRAIGGLTVDGATLNAKNNATQDASFGTPGINTGLTAINGAKVNISSVNDHGICGDVIVSGAGTVVNASSASGEHYGIFAGKEDIFGELGGDQKGNFTISDGAVVTASGGKGAMRWKPDLSGYTDPVVAAGDSAAAEEIIGDPAGTEYQNEKYVQVRSSLEPVEPTEPTDPTDPTTPTDPTEPTDPAKPEQQGKPSGQTESPQTGDSSDMALWISLMMASCGGVLGMLFYRRKKAAAGK
ncbi:carbohydrate-binding domain-containing protein [Gallibacter intestinalis]|uniref:Fibronectin type-III domain-containing protein n=1 Tax=Gallibacter intestinalis TaxID=2779356 RepID=A0ABR9QWX5_9FIRM|nr:carbohydrate-binding domain-containing protein [Gallibacter intestinalis]MBE5035377.1 hypothetical protein [Gallibacter intestinalis]